MSPQPCFHTSMRSNDIYIVVSPEHAGRALDYVEQSFSPLGLTLNVAN